MPPKVKSLEVMATQQTEEDTQATPAIPDEQVTQNAAPSQPAEAATATPQTPPKRVDSENGKAGSSSKKVRPTMASLVAMEISNDVEVHPYVVQRILDSLEKTAVTSLNERGVFRMCFMTARLRTRQAQKETGNRVCGRDVTVKAKPERRILNITPTKYLRHQCL